MPIPGSVLGNQLPFGLAAAADLYPSVATLLVLTITVDSTKQELHTFAASTTAGQFNLPCRKSPLIQIRPQNQESQRGQTMQEFDAKYQVNFSQLINVNPLTLATWQVSIDGVVYQILSVENDGSGLTTRFMVAIINPANP